MGPKNIGSVNLLNDQNQINQQNQAIQNALQGKVRGMVPIKSEKDLLLANDSSYLVQQNRQIRPSTQVAANLVNSTDPLSISNANIAAQVKLREMQQQIDIYSQMQNTKIAQAKEQALIAQQQAITQQQLLAQQQQALAQQQIHLGKVSPILGKRNLTAQQQIANNKMRGMMASAPTAALLLQATVSTSDPKSRVGRTTDNSTSLQQLNR